jgi:UDP-GlcNAc:undecaprenyl-phosphate/decaprenyl-phosphate GlcNAc-1-phosphate transferase
MWSEIALNLWRAILQTLHDYQAPGLTAFILTVFATPVAATIARRTGVMDMPDTFLKPHAKPTPYLGGVAICAGWAGAIVLALLTNKAAAGKLVPILLGGAAMSVLGLLDDIRDLRPRIRLALGAIVIAAVLISTQTGFQLVHSMLKPLGVELPDELAIPVSVAIGVFIVLGACNSTNLIDGLDGLCSGVTSIISLAFFVLAAHLFYYRQDEPGHAVRFVLAIGMVGATLGFLPWNFNPAKVFMGDAGSVLLGFNCGMLMLLFAEHGTFRWVIGALMIFALPIFDTALAMFRRWNSGKPIFKGDRSHFYDQLRQRGLSVRRVVFICYALTLLYALIGLSVILIRTRYAVVVFVATCAATAWAAYAARMTHPDTHENGTARMPGAGSRK